MQEKTCPHLTDNNLHSTRQEIRAPARTSHCTAQPTRRLPRDGRSVLVTSLVLYRMLPASWLILICSDRFPSRSADVAHHYLREVGFPGGRILSTWSRTNVLKYTHWMTLACTLRYIYIYISIGNLETLKGALVPGASTTRTTPRIKTSRASSFGHTHVKRLDTLPATCARARCSTECTQYSQWTGTSYVLGELVLKEMKNLTLEKIKINLTPPPTTTKKDTPYMRATFEVLPEPTLICEGGRTAQTGTLEGSTGASAGSVCATEFHRHYPTERRFSRPRGEVRSHYMYMT